MTKRTLLGALSGAAILGLMGWSGAGALANSHKTAEPPPTPVVEAALQTAEAPRPQAKPAAIQLTQPERRGQVTHLPIPRFVSLKGARGNARRGPSLSHRIDWVFTHPGMPLRVTAEYGHWRRVEDRDGQGGWVHYTLLSGVRTVVVTKDMVALHSRPEDKSEVVAKAQIGAVARLGNCDRSWCEIESGPADGWLPKADLWGVDPNERRD